MKRTRVLFLGTVAAAAAASAVAWAAIPGADGTISGCYRAGGHLRVVDSATGQTCRSDEKSLVWNQKGPAGPAGAPGSSASGSMVVFGPTTAQVDNDVELGSFGPFRFTGRCLRVQLWSSGGGEHPLPAERALIFLSSKEEQTATRVLVLNTGG